MSDQPKLRQVLRDHDGKPSASRIPMLLFGLIVTGAWLAIGVRLWAHELAATWEHWSGFMSWGRDLFFGTIVGFGVGKGVDVWRNGRE